MTNLKAIEINGNPPAQAFSERAVVLKEVATFYEVNEVTIKRQIKIGKIPGEKVMGRWYVDRVWFEIQKVRRLQVKPRYD
jgi:hypothetical protein